MIVTYRQLWAWQLFPRNGSPQRNVKPELEFLQADIASNEKEKRRNWRPEPAGFESSISTEMSCLPVVVNVRWYHVTIQPPVVIMSSIETYWSVVVLRIVLRIVLRVVPVLWIPI